MPGGASREALAATQPVTPKTSKAGKAARKMSRQEAAGHPLPERGALAAPFTRPPPRARGAPPPRAGRARGDGGGALGQARVHEVLVGISVHAEPFHHPSGPMVFDGREGDDLAQPGPFEPVVERGPRALGRIAAPPMRDRQPPAHLHARRESGLEPRNRQPDHADEGGATRDLDRPEPEPVGQEVGLNPRSTSAHFHV